MPQNNWKTIFENQVKLREDLINRIKRGKSNLKFNRPYLIVSDIASQFYSEAQLELDYIFGKIETEEQKEGAKLHEKMAEDAVVIKFKKLMENIQQVEEIVIMETTYLMKFNDNIIIGKPDVIIFKRGIPIFLFEYKFSNYSTTFPNQRVQAQIYCQMLKEMGYNTDLLCYGIIVAPRDMTKKSKNVKYIPREILQRIDLNSLIQEQEKKVQIDEIRVFLYKFDSEKAKKDLKWALKYWKGKREVKLSELLYECKRHEHSEKCKITYSIIQDLIERFSENIISIYGIGSFFDRKLPDDWIKNDIDMICIVKNIQKIPKIQDWTEVRRLDYKKNHYKANVFFNSLEGLKHKEVYEKESWANFKWALLDFKIPQNSVILYGKPLFDELPEVDSIPYDYEDLLRHTFYNLNNSFKLKDEEAAKNKFTKGVFKFAFLISVYFDPSFKYTSIVEITLKIKELVENQKINANLYDFLLICVNFRRGIPFSEEFLSLRDKFMTSCFYQLYEGKLWKKYEWEEIIQFCRITYNGLYALENAAKREQNRFYSKLEKE
ncbi:MAG: hypothetical protein ACFFG0_35880 [Candidatus Thorarchaeota archaeon]